MKKIIGEIIEVLKTGHIAREKQGIKKCLWSVIKIFILMSALRLIVLLFTGLVLYLLGIEIPENLTQTSLSERSFMGRMFLALILAPVLEECATRLGLVFSIRNFVIATSLLLFYSLHYVVNKIGIVDTIGSISMNQRILISGIYGVMTFVLLVKNNKIKEFLANFWKRHKRVIFYASFLFFGYMHLFNYELTAQNIMISPIMLSSHFIMGIFLGYARLKLGLFSAIGLHTLNNSITYMKYLF